MVVSIANHATVENFTPTLQYSYATVFTDAGGAVESDEPTATWWTLLLFPCTHHMTF